MKIKTFYLIPEATVYNNTEKCGENIYEKKDVDISDRSNCLLWYIQYFSSGRFQTS